MADMTLKELRDSIRGWEAQSHADRYKYAECRDSPSEGTFSDWADAIDAHLAGMGEPVAWRAVVGFEGLYEVSSDGQIRSASTGKLLSSKSLMGSGYVKADLWKDGVRTQTTVHRIVARAFLGDGEEVNHKNGDKTDNRVENLEWCTRSENANHSYYVLGNQVHAITAISKATGEQRHYASVEMAVRDGFNSAHIYRALKNPQRTHNGFFFQTAAPPASGDWGKVREVATALRSVGNDHHDAWADKLTAALPESKS